MMVGLKQKGSSKEVTLRQNKITALQIEKNKEGCKNG